MPVGKGRLISRPPPGGSSRIQLAINNFSILCRTHFYSHKEATQFYHSPLQSNNYDAPSSPKIKLSLTVIGGKPFKDRSGGWVGAE